MSLVKRIGKIGAIALGTAYLGTTLPFAFYQLHKTEYGVEKRFGAVVAIEKKPGPHIKDKPYIPGFLTIVERLDNRIQEYLDPGEKIMTKDHKYMLADRFCKWMIENPEKYVNRVRTEKFAQSLLDDVIYGIIWEFVPSHTFEENQTTIRKEIREGMVKKANETLKDYGIKIIDIRIKKVNIPEESRKKIHERMVAEQKKRAAEIKAEGEGRKREILGEKEKIVRTLEAEGRNEAEKLLGEAEKKVAETYQGAYEKDLEFYKFWERMKTYEALAESNPTLVISPDHPLFDEPFDSEKKKEKKE